MKLLRKFFIVFVLLGSLQIVAESFLQDQKVISTELNLEIEKEEKETEIKTEFFERNELLTKPLASFNIHNNFIVGPYQDPALSVWISPPEQTV